MLTYTQFTPLPNNPNPQAKPSHAPCRVVRCVIISSKPDKRNSTLQAARNQRRKRECATGTEKPPVGCEPTGGLIKRNYSLISYTSLPSSGTEAHRQECAHKPE